MRVFRCLSAREITNIYKGNNERCAVVQGNNSFCYEEGKKYIHFFRYSESALYYYNYYRATMNPLDFYIAYMVANIPNDVLERNFGYGYYCNYHKLFMGDIIPIPEYAIPIEEFNKDYVVQVNHFIETQYKNDKEHQAYLNLILKLQKTIGYDEMHLKDYLMQYSLQELLNVKDDNRCEKEIDDAEWEEHLNKLIRAFPNGICD